MELTVDDKQFLLKVVKDTIFSQLAEDDMPEYFRSKELYKELHGVFLKITYKEKVRAYGGVLEPEEDLISTVQNVTINACFRDTRFLPLNKDEMDTIHINMAIVDSFDELRDRTLIKPDLHGIYIEFGQKRGVLLPWDISEFNLDASQYVREAAVKAGIEDFNNAKLKLIRLITFSDRDF